MTPPRKPADELQAERRTAWVALLEASFGLANTVSEGVIGAALKSAEESLGTAAVRFADTHRAVVELLRPPAPPRLRRSTASPSKSIEEVQRDSGIAWAGLVKAAFAIKNAVNDQLQGDPMNQVEAALAQAAIQYAEARQAMLALLRPRSRARRRR